MGGVISFFRIQFQRMRPYLSFFKFSLRATSNSGVPWLLFALLGLDRSNRCNPVCCWSTDMNWDGSSIKAQVRSVQIFEFCELSEIYGSAEKQEIWNIEISGTLMRKRRGNISCFIFIECDNNFCHLVTLLITFEDLWLRNSGQFLWTSSSFGTYFENCVLTDIGHISTES